MMGRERSRRVALPGQIAIYLMRDKGHISMQQIGNSHGGRDHTILKLAVRKYRTCLNETIKSPVKS
jgi:chromosomal replication initiation ATPase DnaA